jgi:hypothetical protein
MWAPGYSTHDYMGFLAVYHSTEFATLWTAGVNDRCGRWQMADHGKPFRIDQSSMQEGIDAETSWPSGSFLLI